MKLYKEASLMMLPTSVKDGKLYSIFPQPKPLSGELVTNGTFDTDSDWTKQTAWSINNGVANYDGSANGSLLRQFNVLTIGKLYKLNFDISNNSGSYRIGGSFSNNIYTTYSYGNGSNTIYFEATATDVSIGGSMASGGDTFSIDNISVVEVDQAPADFDFSRGADRATRVTEQGLVRPVEIVGSELVQNGDFEQLGNNEITIGEFNSQSDVDGFSIAGNRATKSLEGGFMRLTYTAAIGAALTINHTVTKNKSYKVTFRAKGTANAFFGSIGANNSVLNNPEYAVSNPYLTTDWQNYEFYIPFGDEVSFRFYLTAAQIGDTLDIDDIVIQEVGQNWDFYNDAYISEGRAYIVGDGSSFTHIDQDAVFTIGKTYKVTLDAVINSGLGLKVQDGVTNENFGVITSSGTYTFYGTANSTSLTIGRRTGGTAFDSYVDNISAVEVTEATDLPRLDWSGECPVLLLEPQRTNIVPTSEGTPQSSTNVILTENYGISPEGVTNSLKVQKNGNSANDRIFPISNNNATLVSGNDYTISCFVKNIDLRDTAVTTVGCRISGSTLFRSGFEWDGQSFSYLATGFNSGSRSNIFAKDYGNGWFRIGFTFQADGTSGNFELDVDRRFGSDTTSIETWGWQLEQGSYATSYIPTRGQAATRAYDFFENTNLGDYLGTGDATFFFNFDFDTPARESSGMLYRVFSGNNFFGIKGINNANRDMQVFTSASGGNIFSGNIGIDSDAFTSHKIAIRTTGSVIEVFYNGTKLTDTMTGTDTYAWSELRVNANNAFLSKTKEITIFAKSLSDNECINLTTI